MPLPIGSLVNSKLFLICLLMSFNDQRGLSSSTISLCGKLLLLDSSQVIPKIQEIFLALLPLVVCDAHPLYPLHTQNRSLPAHRILILHHLLVFVYYIIPHKFIEENNCVLLSLSMDIMVPGIYSKNEVGEGGRGIIAE